jgi:hypothetical protein
VPGYFSKLLFPKSRSPERRRKMRALQFWLVAILLIIAAVAGLLYQVGLRDVR